MEKFLLLIKKIIPLKIFKAIQPVYHFTLSALAALIYRWPSEKLIVVGVTGTTGKTTSVYLIAKMLTAAGFKAGFTSTAIFNDGRREWLNDKKMTMIGRFFTQRLLRRMVANGCQYAVVETTSQGIEQFRHRFINYDIVIITGLYPEHIEAHGSFDNYRRAKGKLFTHLKRGRKKYVNDGREVQARISNIKKIELKRVKKTIIVNADDEQAGYFLGFWAEERIGITAQTGFRPEPVKANVLAYEITANTNRGVSLAVNRTAINLKLLGGFNAFNAMTAVAVGLNQEIPIEDIKKGLEEIEGVAGRLEKIDAGQNFTVIVDYAFEPTAVKKLYDTVDLIPHKRIIHVLGAAGGGRDIAKRPYLGQLAGEKADIVIITNEDPYDDDPAIIIDQVALGALKTGKKNEENLFKILDRREAITKALTLAAVDDLVLITGKGSEQAICLAQGEKLPWDDRAVVRGILSDTTNGKNNI